MEISLVVFVSSVIAGLEAERQAVRAALQTIPLTRPWVFEFSPASSLPLAESYLSQVRRCDIFLLLLGDRVTDPVKAEVETAQAAGKPLLVFVGQGAPSQVVEYAQSLGVKYATFGSPEQLAAQAAEATADELITGYRRHQVPRSDLGALGAFLDRAAAGELHIDVGGDLIVAQGPVAKDHSATSTGSGLAIAGHIVNLFLTSDDQKKEDEAALYSAALERYLRWMCATSGQVVLRGIKRGSQQAVALPLDDVYVPLAAEALPNSSQALKETWRRQREIVLGLESAELGRTISMHDLLAQGRHLTVIGAPGCGKTTVLQHIAWTLASALHTERPELAAERLGLQGDLPLPIYVPLSLYAEHRRKFEGDSDPRRRQLATFISFYLMDRQAGLDLPNDFFATLLNQGRHMILLLDGLDEVSSDDERALVAQAVQDLTHAREQARFVVTSRTPAYQGKAVLGADFRVVRVLPISPRQVDDLIAAAYRAIYPEAVEQDERARRTTELTQGVAELERERQERLGQNEENRLVTTPLLVRMLLIVQFNLRRLPDQRAELYMEMVDTLLTSSYNPDAEVAQRLAQMGGDWRSRRDMAQVLAFHMHSQGASAGRQIAEHPMAQLLNDYLVERRHKPAEAAEELVADFVANSRERGGLLEEQAGRYRFSHLSFQEFLAARYLAEGLRQVDRVAAFLEEEDRVLQSWWREPALLTIGYLSITAQDAAVELIHQLAGTGFLEWGGADPTRQALARRLAELLEDADLDRVSPALRALAGRALGRLGDPRPGVEIRADGMPDILWCAVAAGEFLMGNTKVTDVWANDVEIPQKRLFLEGFAISKYPITNAQYQAFVADGGYTEKWQHCWTKVGWRWKGNRTNLDKAVGVSVLPNHPVTGVTWKALSVGGRDHAGTRLLRPSPHWRDCGGGDLP